MGVFDEYEVNKIIREIVETIPDNVFVYSKDGVCLYANRNLIETLGFDPTQKHLGEIFPNKNPEELQKILLEHQDLINLQLKQKEDAQIHNLKDRGLVVYQVDKMGLGSVIVGVGKDITELFLAKEELKANNIELRDMYEEVLATNNLFVEAKENMEKTNKELELKNEQLNQFIRFLLHDIKNPVGAISGFSDLIKNYLNNMLLSQEISKSHFDDLRNFLSMIDLSATKIDAFILELHELELLKGGEIKPKYEDVDTGAFLSSILKQQYGFLENINSALRLGGKDEKELKLKIDREGFPCSFKGDKNLLERVLINLIGNSIKFTDKGEIVCKLSQSNGDLCFCVSDTGIGINEEDCKAMFEEFKCLDSDYYSAVKGTGIGLAVVSKIIDTLGGEILPVESKLGEGTTISFKIPNLSKSK